jgi:hypothetical protein
VRLALVPEYETVIGGDLDVTTPDSLWRTLPPLRFSELKDLVGLATGLRIWGNRQAEDTEAPEAVRATLRLLARFTDDLNGGIEASGLSGSSATSTSPLGINQLVVAALSRLGSSAEFCEAIGEYAIAVLSNHEPAGPFRPADEEGDLSAGLQVDLFLSGGGLRAAAFGLGAILYLADVGKLARVGRIYAVSGGSIIASFLEQCRPHPRTATDVLGLLVRRIANHGLPLERDRRSVIVLAASSALTLLLSAAALLMGRLYLSAVAFSLGISLVGAWIFVLGSVGRRSQSWFRSTTAPPDYAPGFVEFGMRRSDWVPVCYLSSTDLIGQEQLHLSQNAYLSRDGEGSHSLSGVERLAASAAFPGALPPLLASLTDSGGNERRVLLADGGIWSNLSDAGEEWDVPPQDACATGRGRGDTVRTALQFFVDASAPARRSARPPLWSTLALLRPFGGQLAVVRSVQTMMRANAAGRLSRIRRTGESSQCLYLDIAKGAADAATDASNDSIAQRWSRSGVEGLLSPYPLDHWRQLAERCARVPTTLDALGPETTVDLLEHGYVSAMVAAHIGFQWPLPERGLFLRPRFLALAT